MDAIDIVAAVDYNSSNLDSNIYKSNFINVLKNFYILLDRDNKYNRLLLNGKNCFYNLWNEK